MTPADLLRLRMVSQGLEQPEFRAPEDVVAWFGAVQAQDYLGSLWAIGSRVRGATEVVVEAAEARHAIVRLWPMRGTLHFVAAADVRWITQLLAPRIVAKNMARWKREMDVDATLVARADELLTDALAGGKRLTREKLYAVLEARKIRTGDMRGLHILLWLALQGRLCFAGRDGKQQTFALLDEWVPQSRIMKREAALVELALRYFTSHGPATLRDFTWWTGLTAKDAQAALAGAATELTHGSLEGVPYWWRETDTPARPVKARRSLVRLLPAFDEYTVAYHDRSLLMDDHAPRPASKMSLLNPAVLVDGRVVGTWKRTLARASVRVHVALTRRLSRAERDALDEAVSGFGRFLGLEASWSGS